MTSIGGTSLRHRASVAFALTALSGCGLVLDAAPPSRDAGHDARGSGIDASRDEDAPTFLPDVAFPDVFLPDAPGADAVLPDVFVPDVFVPPDVDDRDAPPSCDGCEPTGPCDTATCDPFGDCIHQPEVAGTLCRAGFGECDAEERCDGVSSECPDDRVLPVDQVCRASRGECDPPERCDGSNGSCPSDLTGFDFRGACVGGGLCVGDRCMSPLACTPDVPCQLACAPGTTRCRGTTVVCEVPGGAVPLPVGTVCRPSLGACDPEELCNGERSCPIDVRALGDVCRPARGECDAEEVCSAALPTCPADQLADRETACGGMGCRRCSGTSPDCTGVVSVDAFCPSGSCTIEGDCVGGTPICHDDDNPCLVGSFTTGACSASDTLADGELCRVGDGQCVADSFCDASFRCPANVIMVGHACVGWCPGGARVSGTCTPDGFCSAACRMP